MLKQAITFMTAAMLCAACSDSESNDLTTPDFNGSANPDLNQQSFSSDSQPRSSSTLVDAGSSSANDSDPESAPSFDPIFEGESDKSDLFFSDGGHYFCDFDSDAETWLIDLSTYGETEPDHSFYEGYMTLTFTDNYTNIGLDYTIFYEDETTCIIDLSQISVIFPQLGANNKDSKCEGNTLYSKTQIIYTKANQSTKNEFYNQICTKHQ